MNETYTDLERTPEKTLYLIDRDAEELEPLLVFAESEDIAIAYAERYTDSEYWDAFPVDEIDGNNSMEVLISGESTKTFRPKELGYTGEKMEDSE